MPPLSAQRKAAAMEPANMSKDEPALPSQRAVLSLNVQGQHKQKRQRQRAMDAERRAAEGCNGGQLKVSAVQAIGTAR